MKVSEKVKIASLTSNRTYVATPEIKKKVSDGLKLYYQNNPEAKKKLSEFAKNRTYTSETRKKLSDHAKRRKLGGYVPNSIKKHKRGNYKGYHCDSSWELAFVVYNLEHSITFERNTERFPYEFNGKVYNFIPDFILSDGTYLEIKGYIDERVKQKIIQFKYSLEIIDKIKIVKYLDYVINKYGKDFTKLYECN